MSMNHVTIQGNLTRDPETRFTRDNQTPIASFTVAWNNVWRDRNGEKVEECHFFDCVAFDKTAELIGRFFSKGDSILFEGALQQDTWDDRETGDKRSKVKIKVWKIHFQYSRRSERDGNTRDEGSRGGGYDRGPGAGSQRGGGSQQRGEQQRDDSHDGRDEPRKDSGIDYDEIPF
jgi:single-strand DNA-binding protein